MINFKHLTFNDILHITNKGVLGTRNFIIVILRANDVNVRKISRFLGISTQRVYQLLAEIEKTLDSIKKDESKHLTQ